MAAAATLPLGAARVHSERFESNPATREARWVRATVLTLALGCALCPARLPGGCPSCARPVGLPPVSTSHPPYSSSQGAAFITHLVGKKVPVASM